MIYFSYPKDQDNCFTCLSVHVNSTVDSDFWRFIPALLSLIPRFPNWDQPQTLSSQSGQAKSI